MTRDWREYLREYRFFVGGVPQSIVPDNPKATIGTPTAMSTVLDFELCYDSSILQFRPRHLEDNAKA